MQGRGVFRNPISTNFGLQITVQDQDSDFHQFLSIFEARTDDVKFKKMENVDSGESSSVVSSSIEIKLEQLQSLSTNQNVNVEGILSLGPENPKEVNTRDAQIGVVKEDCAIEDETSTAILHIWQNAIKECKDGVAYKISNVSVKNFSGEIFLGTTTETLFATSDFKMDVVEGKELLFATDNEVTVAEFKLVDKVSSFYICQNKACNKRMPSVQHGSAIFQCEACGISQS